MATLSQTEGPVRAAPLPGAACAAKSSCFVAAEPQYPPQPECAHPIFLAGHEPYSHKPRSKSLACTFEDGACRKRGARAATATAQQLIRHGPRLCLYAAVPAHKPTRPA